MWPERFPTELSPHKRGINLRATWGVSGDEVALQ